MMATIVFDEKVVIKFNVVSSICDYLPAVSEKIFTIWPEIERNRDPLTEPITRNKTRVHSLLGIKDIHRCFSIETNIKSVGLSPSKVGPKHCLRVETTFHGLLLAGSITYSFEQYICTANVNTCGLIDNDEVICTIQYHKEKENFYEESGLVAKDNALNMMIEKYFDSQNIIEREDENKKNMSDFNRLALIISRRTTKYSIRKMDHTDSK